MAKDHIGTIGPSFHRLSEAAVDYFYNYTYHFVAATHDRVFVADQVNPSVYVYGLEDKDLLRTIRLSLPGFKIGVGQLPSKFLGTSPGGFNRRDFYRWENEWSRITAIQASEDAIVIAYDLSCSCDKPKKRIVTRSPDDGTILKAYDIGSGLLLGLLDKKLIILRDWDDQKNERPTYVVEKISW